MTTLAIALKDEIRRLARKEIKAQTGSTAKAVAQYRREIARLKRQQRDHERKIAFLQAQARKVVTSSPIAESNGDAGFSARSAKARRRRTGLSAADYTKLVGVSPLTIYNWSMVHLDRAASSSHRSWPFGAFKREAQAKLALLAGKSAATSREQRKKA